MRLVWKNAGDGKRAEHRGNDGQGAQENHYHAVRAGLPAMAGRMGAAYAIPVLYVPLLMITHIVAFYLLLRPQPKLAPALAGEAVAS